MTTLSEQLYGCLDGNKGDLLLHTVDGVQLVAGSKGMLFDGQEHDPFSSCLMDMDLTSSMVEDFMVEDYSNSPSSTTSSPFISSQQYETIVTSVTSASGGMVNVEEGLYNQQWNQIPGYFQEQLFTHYGLYLKEIQQVLDMQKQMDIAYSDTSSTSSSPYSSTPASPAVANKTEKRKKTQNFKVEHYKLQNQLAKRSKREESEPLSPSNDDNNINDSNSNFSSSSSPSTPILRNSNNIESSPTKTLSMVAEELASAFLPSVSQIEEEIRAGTSSPSAASTVMELSKRPELLTLKQSEAAKIMGISTSVLSKRWREATRGKKWPHRIHHKLKRAAIC